MVTFHTTGDKSVTMCGVAQEDVSKEREDDGNVFTKPWHVTVTMKTVRASRSHSLKYCFIILEYILTQTLSSSTVHVLFRVHCERELGADGCSLLCQSEYRKNHTAGGN